MNKKGFLIFLVAVFVLSSLAITVNAAEPVEPNFFESAFSPFGSSLERVYARFSILIDAAIYLIIFLGLTQATIGRKFEYKKGGKAITVGVGLVLAVGLALFERQAGFNIASFGPIAALVLLALMGYAIWIGIKTLEIEGVDTLTMTAITYILVYYSMTAVVPNIIQWINRHIPIIGALLALLAAVFTIYLLVKMVTWIIGLFGKGGAAPPTPAPTPTPTPGQAPAQVPEPEDELKAIMSYLHKAMDKLQALMKGCDSFEAAVRRWAADWNKNKSRAEANKNVNVAVSVLQKGIGEPFDDVKGHVMDAITQARRVIRNPKHSAEIRTKVEKKRGEIEAVYKKLGKIGADRIPGCAGVLVSYIKMKSKKTPTFLQHTIINSHLKYLRGDVGTVHTALGAIWKEVRDLAEKVKVAPRTSA